MEDDLEHGGSLKFAVLGRGLGFLSGLLFNLYVTSQYDYSWFVWCMVVFTVFSSCFTFALGFVADLAYYEVWVVVFPFFQGIGFASCDALGNHFLLEIWRDGEGNNSRGQSWVHIVHAGFTGGGLIGPLFVGALGYKYGFVILGLLSLIPLGLLSISSLSNGSMTSHVSASNFAPPIHDVSGNILQTIKTHTYILK